MEGGSGAGNETRMGLGTRLMRRETRARIKWRPEVGMGTRL